MYSTGCVNIILARDISKSVTPVPPLHRTAKRHEWTRIHRGAYLDLQGTEPDDVSQESWHAAKIIGLAASTPIAVISGLSAAIFHGLPMLYSRIPNLVHVTRASKSTKSEWAHTHQAKLAADEVVEVAGIRCTSITRTIQDLAGTLSLPELLAMADAARAREVDLQPLVSVNRFGRHLRWAVEHASDRSESYAETWSRYHFICAGIELPLQQPSVIARDGTFIGRTDFGTRDGLLGEFDGKVKYGKFLKPGQSAADAVMAEKSRENSLRDTNHELTRWDWDVLRSQQTFLNRWDSAKQRAALLPPPTATLELRPMKKPVVTNWTDIFQWNHAAIG
ncbi:hypothetical protein C7K25_08155 [Gulosibacter molinativorax]|uniref:Uncharacterized protein n=1 Tax=Gulosibacter molinativorax TaxID=256821 RepID=A0ABT7C991_9MICO|nr:hypothetical protein [Gulosibacter molinativorax]QUY63597.1 Hypotetical protein [Gulosibacter molinativorax]